MEHLKYIAKPRNMSVCRTKSI
uniref:Uncharacterized protein n=1 Tax=Anguilla anguilla TaxID=7936 RepID=A0A0E9SRY8_ANGAN